MCPLCKWHLDYDCRRRTASAHHREEDATMDTSSGKEARRGLGRIHQESYSSLRGAAAGLGVSDWVLKQRARKCTLAGRVASQTDGRWSTRVLSWKPWFRIFPKRDVGRPRKRWEDAIVNLAGESWMTEGIDQDMWSILKDAYVQKIM